MGAAAAAAISLYVLVGLLLLWGWWRVLNLIWLRPKKLEKYLRQQGLAGNSYRIPFGDTKDLGMAMGQAGLLTMNFSHDIAARVIPTAHLTLHKYGKNSFTWFGPNPRVHITEPEQLKTAFSLINDIRKSSSLAKATGLVSLEGPQWAKRRKIINPAFHFQKLKDMVPAFCESGSEMITRWESNLVSKEEGYSCELDVWPDLQNMTADVISRTVFGSSFHQGKRIFQLLKESVQLLIIQRTSRLNIIPLWRFVPTKSKRRMEELHGEIQALVLGIISKRQTAVKAGEAFHNDLLGILLESNLDQIGEHGNTNKEAAMSIQDVIDECKVFYFAGQETTAALLVWTMVLLGRYTDWQDRARAEVLELFGNDNKLNFDGLSHLKVVTMILNEVLRLYPPVGMLTRELHKETKLGNLSLPAGISIQIPIINIHHDPEIWGEDAGEFNPERFSEGVSKATKNQVCFIPFGWGPRICVGQNFALIEAKIALSMVLQRFSFELSPCYTHAPISSLIVQPQHGAHLILRKL